MQSLVEFFSKRAKGWVGILITVVLNWFIKKNNKLNQQNTDQQNTINNLKENQKNIDNFNKYNIQNQATNQDQKQDIDNKIVSNQNINDDFNNIFKGLNK